MGLRFYKYEILKGDNDPRLCSVVSTLWESYVKTDTALDLLLALAERGCEFMVLCNGDFPCLADSKKMLQDWGHAEERSQQWLRDILGEDE